MPSPAGQQQAQPSSVQVVVRLRPLNEKEKKHGTLPVITASTNEKSVTVIKGHGARQARSSYRFNNVFTAFSTQEEVFDATLKPIIQGVLRQGFESTVFAYGQTGTGKTYTMEGELADEDMHGVIPRSAHAIFEALEDPAYISHTVSCSFLEIYNEDLCDLLVETSASGNNATSPTKKRVSTAGSPSKRGSATLTAAGAPKLDIMEGKNGPFCRGLSETQVASAQEVLSLMRKAQQQRQVGETNMNKQSSRSHCIFSIKIVAEKRLPDESVLKVSGKLHCVDLAGSECAKSASLGGAEDRERERERMNINRSLLTLGRVISMLKDQTTGKIKANSRIPYRDSKLTRILQESLGGRCKTCLIATVSPSVTAIEESISTLNYAQAANDIINKPITSSYMTHIGTGGSPSKPVEGGEGGNEGGPGEVQHWYEMEVRLNYMQSQVDEAQQALARKHLQTQEYIDKAEKAEAACEEAMEKYNQATEENEQLKEELTQQISENETLAAQLAKTEVTLEFTKGELAKQIAENEAIAEQLARTERALKETTAILRATQHTETCLTNEAKDLIDTLKQSIVDGDEMYQVLVNNRDEDIRRRQATRDFNDAISALFGSILQSATKISSLEQEHHASMRDAVGSNSLRQTDFLDRHQEIVDKIAEDVNHAVGVLKQKIIGDDDALVPYVVSSATAVRKGLQQAGDNVDESSTHLQVSCEHIREHLTSCSSRLNAMEEKYNACSAELLATLAQNVMKSKESMSSLSASLSKTLNTAREKRTKSRQALKALVAEWNSSSHQSTDTIKEMASTQGTQVQETLQMLTSEMKRHDEIERYLSDQRGFLHSVNTEYLGELRNQGTLLSKQRETFDDSHERTKEFCQQFVSNVMAGVTELLKDQMTLMTEHHHKNYGAAVAGNQELIRSNAAVTESAKNILEAVKTTNKRLQDETKAVRSNEEEVANVLKDAASMFGDIGSCCNEQKKITTSFAESTAEELDGDDSADTADVEQAITVMSHSFEQSRNDLTANVQEVTGNNVAQLSAVTKEMYAFVANDVITTSKSKISDSIEMPGKESTLKLRDNIENIRSRVNTTEEKIQSIAKEHCEAAEHMKDRVECESSRLQSKGTDQKRVIKDQESALTAIMEEQKKSVLVEVSGSQTSASSGKKSVDDFSRNVIMIDKDVEPLADRVLPSYSEDLTVTPPVEAILAPQSIFWSMLEVDPSPLANCLNNVESLQVEPVPVG